MGIRKIVLKRIRYDKIKQFKCHAIYIHLYAMRCDTMKNKLQRNSLDSLYRCRIQENQFFIRDFFFHLFSVFTIVIALVPFHLFQ